MDLDRAAPRAVCGTRLGAGFRACGCGRRRSVGHSVLRVAPAATSGPDGPAHRRRWRPRCLSSRAALPARFVSSPDRHRRPGSNSRNSSRSATTPEPGAPVPVPIRQPASARRPRRPESSIFTPVSAATCVRTSASGRTERIDPELSADVGYLRGVYPAGTCRLSGVAAKPAPSEPWRPCAKRRSASTQPKSSQRNPLTRSLPHVLCHCHILSPRHAQSLTAN
jgi:hypothetical protein